MNRDIVEGNWKQFMGKVQTRWGLLIGDHLGAIAGRRTQMVGERQRAYGVVCSRTLSGSTSPGYPAWSIVSNRKAGGASIPTAPIMIVLSRENR